MRDDFSTDTIRRVGERVGLLCSNPDCGVATKGPHTAVEKAANLGKACHVHAASPGGPRYLAEQTPDQRASIENAIWLCSNCAVAIDADPERFPADLLRAWKTLAEHRAKDRLGKVAAASSLPAAPPRYRVELTLAYAKVRISQDLHRYELDVRLKNVGARRIDDWYIEIELPTCVVEKGITILSKVADRSDERTSVFRSRIGDADAGPSRRALLVGDNHKFGIPYFMDHTLFRQNTETNNALFSQVIRARAFVDGELTAEQERPFDDLQCF